MTNSSVHVLRAQSCTDNDRVGMKSPPEMVALYLLSSQTVRAAALPGHIRLLYA